MNQFIHFLRPTLETLIIIHNFLIIVVRISFQNPLCSQLSWLFNGYGTKSSTIMVKKIMVNFRWGTKNALSPTMIPKWPEEDKFWICPPRLRTAFFFLTGGREGGRGTSITQQNRGGVLHIRETSSPMDFAYLLYSTISLPRVTGILQLRACLKTLHESFRSVPNLCIFDAGIHSYGSLKLLKLTT